MTDNSYNVFEGPVSFGKDANTGRLENTSYTPLHMFAPVSPKLMVVLRSMTFPIPLEDANEAVKMFRELHRKVVLDLVYSNETKSMLADLPVDKARNNYSRVVDGRLEFLSGIGRLKRKEDHRFYFTVFPISSKHVNTINAVLLDNCATSTSVVFKTQSVFAKTLEWYLTAPSNIGKVVTGDDAERRGEMLDKLEALSRHLGSREETVRSTLEDAEELDYEAFRQHRLEENRRIKMVLNGEIDTLRKEWEAKQPKSEFARIYEILGPQPWPQSVMNDCTDRLLGGSRHCITKDFQQARRMWTLRVKIDSWSQGIDESIRQRNRDILTDAYLKLPEARFWLFAKCSRLVVLCSSSGCENLDRLMPGTEDTIAQGKSRFLVATCLCTPTVLIHGMPRFCLVKQLTRIPQAAHSLVAKGKLNKLLHNLMEATFLIGNGVWSSDVWEDITPNYAGLFKMSFIHGAVSKMVQMGG